MIYAPFELGAIYNIHANWNNVADVRFGGPENLNVPFQDLLDYLHGNWNHVQFEDIHANRNVQFEDLHANRNNVQFENIHANLNNVPFQDLLDYLHANWNNVQFEDIHANLNNVLDVRLEAIYNIEEHIYNIHANWYNTE